MKNKSLTIIYYNRRPIESERSMMVDSLGAQMGAPDGLVNIVQSDLFNPNSGLTAVNAANMELLRREIASDNPFAAHGYCMDPNLENR